MQKVKPRKPSLLSWRGWAMLRKDRAGESPNWPANHGATWRVRPWAPPLSSATENFKRAVLKHLICYAELLPPSPHALLLTKRSRIVAQFGWKGGLPLSSSLYPNITPSPHHWSSSYPHCKNMLQLSFSFCTLSAKRHQFFILLSHFWSSVSHASAFSNISKVVLSAFFAATLSRVLICSSATARIVWTGGSPPNLSNSRKICNNQKKKIMQNFYLGASAHGCSRGTFRMLCISHESSCNIMHNDLLMMMVAPYSVPQ